MDGKWGLGFLSFLSLFLLNYASEILYGGSPCISLEPRAPPFGRGAIGALAAYFLPNFRQIGQEMGFKLLSLFLLNYESYSVKNLYEGSPCILFGCGTINDTLVAYYSLNLSQFRRLLGSRKLGKIYLEGSSGAASSGKSI